MGDIAKVTDGEVELAIEVIGSAPIERLDIYDGLDLIETVRPYGAGDLGRRVRLVYEGAEYRGRARTTTWDGSLSIEGNRILRTAVINNWNLDRGIQKQDETGLTWKAVTTGNYGAIDLWLDQPAAGRLAFKTAPVSGEAAIAELGVEPRVFEAGGLERAIKLQRLPETMSETRMALKRTDQGARQGRYAALRARAAGGRAPHVVEPDLSVSVMSQRRGQWRTCSHPGTVPRWLCAGRAQAR